MEGCSKLLDLIPKDREWLLRRDKQRSHGCSEEKGLELRLGPPGGGDEDTGSREREDSILSLGYFSNNSTCGAKRGFKDTVGLPVMAKESSQPCSNKVVDSSEKKAFSPASADTAVPNSSQKRTAPAPVVGWPPIRSFRKNLASSSSSKQALESQNAVPSKVSGEKPVESGRKGLFVKINMDGVPIGRKVDLAAYDSYEKLSIAVDELFRGLLAAQRDSSAGGIQNKQEGEKVITGLLDGSGEYTLVYEDNEGDRVLVGDVPWHMFVSTVKRLRVLKSSELSSLRLGSKQEKIPPLR
ncbi:Auxin-responsive protein [Actinidia chinensis var. chinensis]|uniref:Auxin-responsive protein n=1 Tax=Actinidia chinensis var. chinensis TaxID=1590841 RepID=A0A2R6PST0_ACTCC|nr:Auxin-responsive protein [Actinidia chinensis var. chinensis]